MAQKFAAYVVLASPAHSVYLYHDIKGIKQ